MGTLSISAVVAHTPSGSRDVRVFVEGVQILCLVEYQDEVQGDTQLWQVQGDRQTYAQIENAIFASLPTSPLYFAARSAIIREVFIALNAQSANASLEELRAIRAAVEALVARCP